MKNFLIILVFFFVSNCTLNKTVKHHGIHFLDKKQQDLKLSISNKNDIVKLLGPPSTKSTFDNDIWIYIERKTTKASIIKLGKKKLIVNNVLVLEIDNKGLLLKKDFFNIDDMNKLTFSDKSTILAYSKRSFVYDFLSSLRQKINDPLGNRNKKK